MDFLMRGRANLKAASDDELLRRLSQILKLRELLEALPLRSRSQGDAGRVEREENRRPGIPNVRVDGEGRLTEELPDGSVRLIVVE